MDNQRLILFIVFSFSLLLLWEAWQSRHEPALPTEVGTSEQSAVPSPSQELATSAAVPSSPSTVQSGLSKGDRAIVETDVLRAEIDANGGDLRSLQLLPYRETEDKSKVFTLFEDSTTRPYLAQSGLIGEDMPSHRTPFQINPGTYRLSGGAAQTGSAAGLERSVDRIAGRKDLCLQARQLSGRPQDSRHQRGKQPGRPDAVLSVHPSWRSAAWRVVLFSTRIQVRRSTRTRRNSRKSILPISKKARPTTKRLRPMAGSG
jgi:hypothetical protein